MRNQKEESLKHSKFQFQAEIRFTTVSPLAENNCFVENTLKVTEEQRNEVDISTSKVEKLLIVKIHTWPS